MADCIDAILDHVAIAVPDWDIAERRWRDQFGGGRVAWEEQPTFRSRQLRFTGGAKLELLSPPWPDVEADNFVRRFLHRFGAAVHHVTLKVADLHAALDVVSAAGLEVVDVDDENELWREGFLRPSQVGGLLVQVASSDETDAEWAARVGHTPEPPRPDAATLLGPRLRHPDLDRAAAVWTLLGAEVDRQGGSLRCRWPDSLLDVAVEAGEPAGPLALRFRGTGDLGAQPGIGPPVESV